MKTRSVVVVVVSGEWLSVGVRSLLEVFIPEKLPPEVEEGIIMRGVSIDAVSWPGLLFELQNIQRMEVDVEGAQILIPWQFVLAVFSHVRLDGIKDLGFSAPQGKLD